MKTWRCAWTGFAPISLAVSLAVSLVAFLLAYPPPAPGAEILKLATTTSTQFTGLLDRLHPPFEKKFRVRIHTIAVGTGKALRLGQNGDVDVVLVHAPAAEKAFVSKGYGVNRRGVMYNDFVIVGPAPDPAGVAGTRGVSAALQKIAALRVKWVSRGDDSGTHKKEKILWRKAGLSTSGEWYRSLGQGMGKTLQIADEMNAYTLSDRGSFLFFEARGKVDLRILVEGSKSLLNPYGVIAVNSNRHPHVHYDLAMKYIRFLTSAQGQELIGSFRVKGKKLFHPSAAPARPGN
ncbi:MAG: substrate-binding domain-containing protein [Nitrospinota bacterium]